MLILFLISYLALGSNHFEQNLLEIFFISPKLRIVIIGLISAIIAVAIAEKYRKKILSFLGATFGLIAGSIGCILYSLAGLIYLYIFYRAGLAVFVEGNVFKGFLIAFLIGPILSGIGYGMIYGLFGLALYYYKLNLRFLYKRIFTTKPAKEAQRTQRRIKNMIRNK